MKPVLKYLAFISIALFIIGLLATGYLFYESSEILIKSDIINYDEQFSLLKTLIIPIVTLCCTLFFACLSIFLLITTYKNTSNNSNIYITENKQAKNNSKGHKDSSDDIIDFVDQEKLTPFREIINSPSELESIFDKTLSMIAKELEASQAALFLTKEKDGTRHIELTASFAYAYPESQKITYEFGEGLAGQVAKEEKIVNIKSVPQGYIKILSGLGSATPKHLIIIPIKSNNILYGVVEIASFKEFLKKDEDLLKSIFSILAARINKEKQTQKDSTKTEKTKKNK